MPETCVSPRKWTTPAWAVATLLCYGLVACTEDAAVTGPAKDGASAPDVPDTAIDAAATPVVEPVTFNAGPEPGAPHFHLEGAWLPESGRLKVVVWIGRFDDVLGVAGHLRFDPAALELAKVEAADVPSGIAPNTDWEVVGVAKQSPAGRVLLGGARFRKEPSAYAAFAGAEVLREAWAVLEFVPKKAGTTTIAFDSPSIVARDSEGKDVAVTANPATVTVPASVFAAAAGGTP
ncbi:MAG: hypothetical protein EXR79_01605 [Myxococcales bacterium]|nr:hypothetical protein [Myxococcales bacterium]